MSDPAHPRRPRMDAWRRRFTRNLLLFTAALQVPAGVLLASLLRRALHVPALAAGALAVVALVALHVPLFRRLSRWWTDQRAHWTRVWLFDTPFFVHFCASLLFAPLGYLALLAAFARALAAGPSGAPLAAARYLGPLYVLCALVGAYATLVRRFWTVTRRVEVFVRDLPPALDGYTVVHLSDVHCGPYLPRWQYRALARRATALAPDAIVLTGDLIADGAAYLDDVSEFVRGLSARDGVFAGLGNHDYYGTVEGVPDAVRAGGATVLRNEGVSLGGARGAAFYLAAVDDSWSRRDDLSRALAARPAGAPCVLLAHDPAGFEDLAARGDLDVVLSGHTHGGQFAVPFLDRRYNLARLRHAQTSGLYHQGRTTLFVHRGNGTSGPPARLGAAPEIVAVVLRRSRETR